MVVQVPAYLGSEGVRMQQRLSELDCDPTWPPAGSVGPPWFLMGNGPSEDLVRCSHLVGSVKGV